MRRVSDRDAELAAGGAARASTQERQERAARTETTLRVIVKLCTVFDTPSRSGAAEEMAVEAGGGGGGGRRCTAAQELAHPRSQLPVSGIAWCRAAAVHAWMSR